MRRIVRWISDFASSETSALLANAMTRKKYSVDCNLIATENGINNSAVFESPPNMRACKVSITPTTRNRRPSTKICDPTASEGKRNSSIADSFSKQTCRSPTSSIRLNFLPEITRRFSASCQSGQIPTTVIPSSSLSSLAIETPNSVTGVIARSEGHDACNSRTSHGLIRIFSRG